MINPIQRLHALGQSIWLDNIQRLQLENGEIAELIARGDIRGMTSNPSIFQKAIAKSHDYDSALCTLAWSGWDTGRIFWQLATEDIRHACDLFLPLYRETDGTDGYVSIEVNPMLAHQTEATIAQAKHLWQAVDHPNVMIKIPATSEGLPAIRQSIAAGINVNVTLIFSIQRYSAVMDAYLAGLDDRMQVGLPVETIASVASFFVSRMDTKVDKELESIGSSTASTLLGKTAIAYSKLAYDKFRAVFSSERFTRFQSSHSRLQRPLWASTSTKNPAYPDTLYVDNLIGPDTVNTIPPQTLDAFREHGKAELTVTADLNDARNVITDLEELGISMDKVTQELEDEGVKTFADSFIELLKTIEGSRSVAVSELGPLAIPVSRRVAHLEVESVPTRLWEGDPSLWTKDPNGQDEVRIRMGWLKLPETSHAAIKDIQVFSDKIRAAGLNNILLLGMGGSSLTPEVMSLIFDKQPSTINFSILDSTDPSQILDSENKFPPKKTLYIVSSKSGGTAEVKALFDYFWERSGKNGDNFVAITDPGTTLEALANARGFCKTFLADPGVGGRYSALTHFGLVPAALLGIDLNRLLDRAVWMSHQCDAKNASARNPGLVLGAILGQAAQDGRNKLTFIADPEVAPFSSWLEQLIAESSGKQGKGILPVVGEPILDPEGYGNDRLFIYLRRDGLFDAEMKALLESGHPVLSFYIRESYELGAEFFRWEVAVAVACHILRVNAFDQPDVQDAKDRTRAKIVVYNQSKKLDDGKPIWKKAGVEVYSPQPVSGKGLTGVIKAFLGMARMHDYIAINAYLPHNADTIAALNELRLAIRAQTGCATTVGFGPRFLHSTGQLQKGGPDTGLFLQITAKPSADINIPGEGISFGLMEHAQALGDYEALSERGRRILRVQLPSENALEILFR